MNDLWKLDRQLATNLDISSDLDGIPDPMRGLVRDKVLVRVEEWDEHAANTHSDIDFAWEILQKDGDTVKAGLLMLQSVARSLAVLADEAEERRRR